MKREVIVRLHASFEELVQTDTEGGEFWLARDLQELLGYAKWENFAKVIERAKLACQGARYDPLDHFLDVRKMVDLGSGATRAINGDALQTEPAITTEHIKNNKDVRDLLTRRGIKPEALPASEDIKKQERRVQAEAKKLSAGKKPAP
jgi:hypothetical protein